MINRYRDVMSSSYPRDKIVEPKVWTDRNDLIIKKNCDLRYKMILNRAAASKSPSCSNIRKDFFFSRYYHLLRSFGTCFLGSPLHSPSSTSHVHQLFNPLPFHSFIHSWTYLLYVTWRCSPSSNYHKYIFLPSMIISGERDLNKRSIYLKPGS